MTRTEERDDLEASAARSPDGSDHRQEERPERRQSERRRDFELRESFDRILALRSAWGVLASSGLWAAGQHIADTGRGLNDELKAVASLGLEGRDKTVLPRIEALVDVFAAEMRAIAGELPVAELRTTLRGEGAVDRAGVLALLDLMLGSEINGLAVAAGHVASIDCLITFLSAVVSGDADVAQLQDPVGLTPRLNILCQEADEIVDVGLAELETEFLAAAAPRDADKGEGEADPFGLGSPLWQRKLELGSSYFVPSLLRAILTYNAAVFRRGNAELRRSQDWGGIPGQPPESDSGVSVFETTALPSLGEAMQRRLSGGAPDRDAIDRVAWCLDLGYMNASERGELLTPSLGRQENVKGTVILVGLLSRASVVLADELPAIGISLDLLSTQWIRELDRALKEQINERISHDAYPEACALTELKSKFLYESIIDLNLQKQRRVVSQEKVQEERVREEASQLAVEAIEAESALVDAKSRMAQTRGWRARLARFSRVGGAIAGLGLATMLLIPTNDMGSFSRAELDRVSDHLVSGGRNQQGSGSTFVGTIADEWSELAASQREGAARQLVDRLRAQGIRDVMIYDDDRRLKIQALGKRPLWMAAAGSP